MGLVDKNALAALQDMGFFASVQDPNHIYRFFADLSKKSLQIADQDWQILFEVTGGATGGTTPHINWVSDQGNDATAIPYTPFSPYKTITAAQNASVFGDLVLVMPGNYTDMLSTPGINVYLMEGVELVLASAITCTPSLTPMIITGQGNITNLGGGFVVNTVSFSPCTLNIECNTISNLGDFFSVIGNVIGDLTVNAKIINHGGNNFISYVNSGADIPSGNTNVNAPLISTSSIGSYFNMSGLTSAVANTHYLSFKEANLNALADVASFYFVFGATSKQFFINGELLNDTTVFVGGSFATIFIASTSTLTKCYIDIQQANGSSEMQMIGVGVAGFSSIKGRYDGNSGANGFNVIGMSGNGEFNGIVTGYSDGGLGVIQFGNLGIASNNFVFNGAAYNKGALAAHGVFLQPATPTNVLFKSANIYVTDPASFSVTAGGPAHTIQVLSMAATNAKEPAIVDSLGGTDIVLASLFNPYVN